MPARPPTKEDTIPDATEEQLEDFEIILTVEHIDFKVDDQVNSRTTEPEKFVKKEMRTMLGVEREYLTINITHNDMTVMVP